MLWWLTPEGRHRAHPEYYRRWAPDLAKDPVLMFLDKYHFVFPLLTAGILYAIGGMPYMVWGSFVATVTVLHSTWFVNSATHVWGYMTHATRDDSTYLWWVALLTYGEGWHNNHHSFQTSARHGLRWWEIDMTYIGIKLMSLVGLTHSIKLAKVAKAAPEANGERTSKVKAALAQATDRRARGELVGRRKLTPEPIGWRPDDASRTGGLDGVSPVFQTGGRGSSLSSKGREEEEDEERKRRRSPGFRLPLHLPSPRSFAIPMRRTRRPCRRGRETMMVGDTRP